MGNGTKPIGCHLDTPSTTFTKASSTSTLATIVAVPGDNCLVYIVRGLLWTRLKAGGGYLFSLLSNVSHVSLYFRCSVSAVDLTNCISTQHLEKFHFTPFTPRVSGISVSSATPSCGPDRLGANFRLESWKQKLRKIVYGRIKKR